MDDIFKNLTIEEILQLKKKCSKKIFKSFLENKCKNYNQQNKNEKPDINDKEFEKIFGCKRNINYKPSIKLSLLNPDRIKEEKVLENDKPKEITSKFRPNKLRKIFDTNKNKKLVKTRDPRFENSSGYFNPKRFDKSYSFIKDARENDKNFLKKSLKKVKDEEKKKEIKKVLQRFDNQEKSEQQLINKRKLKDELIEEKKQVLKSNNKDLNKPVYVNKSEIKKKELVEKFKKLKKNKMFNKYLEKKRKKNVGKDRKLLFSNDDEL